MQSHSSKRLDLYSEEFFIETRLIDHGLRIMKRIFHNKPRTSKCWIGGKLVQFYFYFSMEGHMIQLIAASVNSNSAAK